MVGEDIEDLEDEEGRIGAEVVENGSRHVRVGENLNLCAFVLEPQMGEQVANGCGPDAWLLVHICH